VPRLNGHSSADNQSYKDDATMAEEWARDPLRRLRALLLDRRWCERELDDLVGQVETDVRKALDRALAAIAETVFLNEERQITWSFSGLEDPSDAVAILKIQNASLEPNRMLEVARVCSQALFSRSSIQPEKETALSCNNDLTAMTDKKLKEDKPVDDQFQQQLKRLIFNSHKSAKNFFESNRYDYQYSED